MFELLHGGCCRDRFLVPWYQYIYVNDISESSKLPSFLLSAEKTNLFYSHRNPEILNQIANQELCKVADWLRASQLSLNISKTRFIIF